MTTRRMLLQLGALLPVALPVIILLRATQNAAWQIHAMAAAGAVAFTGLLWVLVGGDGE